MARWRRGALKATRTRSATGRAIPQRQPPRIRGQFSGAGAGDPDRPPTPRAEIWHADPLGWTLAGGGVAVGALGAFFLFDARSLHSDVDRELRDDVREELRAKADSRQTWVTVGAVTGVGEVVAIVAQVVSVLQAAHECEKGRIIHRDIKPEKILLAASRANPSDDSVTVVDFGVCKIEEDRGGGGGRNRGSRSGIPTTWRPCTGAAIRTISASTCTRLAWSRGRC
jgi:serine/threonine protein kinase